MVEPCTQMHRFEFQDTIGKELKAEIHVIRDDLDNLKDSLNEIKIDIRGFAATITGVVQRMDERDQRMCEISITNKTSFERFGTRIDELEKQIVVLKIENAKNQWIEKIIWGVMGGGASALLGIAVWVLQR